MSQPTAENLSQHPFSNGREEIDALYTPLGEAMEELRKRRLDERLGARVADYHRELPPTFLPDEPFGALSRFIIMPTHEVGLFAATTHRIGLRPLYLERERDVFFGRNPEKRCLCSPTFALQGTHKRRLKLLGSIALNDGTPLNQIHLPNGRRLFHYHHTLLESAHPGSTAQIADISELMEQAPRDGLFYLRFLALFVVNGILFENFVVNDKAELRFTREKVFPSFARAVELFGVRPLIVRLLPVESEGDDHWRCLPGELFPYARELLRAP